ncbi:MAG TPA: hypothetical protein VKA46_07825 [Gemmataceae bacterium]|nr:hypothetical protein [Gemmataceae bacterium]
MKRFIKPAVVLTALVIGLVLAPQARAQYRSYYYSTSATTFTPPPFVVQPPSPTPIVVYASGAGTPVNFGTGRALYYEPGYPTSFNFGKIVLTPPPTETSNYYSPTFSNRPSYTYTPGYYSPYYTPAYYTPTTSPTTRYYRN